MATTTSTITTSPGTTEFFSGGSNFTVTAGSSNGSSITFSQDAQGLQVLATVAAGATASFTSPGGFFYSSPSVCGATVVQVGAKAYELVGGGTVVTNTATETVTAQFAIPANVIQSGSSVRIRYSVKATQVNSTNTFQPILRFGAAGTSADTALITHAAVNPTANWNAFGEFVLVFQAAPGATVAAVGEGTYGDFAALGGAVYGSYVNSTNFATNAITYVTLTITQSAASANNKASAQIFEVIIN